MTDSFPPTPSCSHASRTRTSPSAVNDRQLLACIGEQFPDANQICGAVVSIRKAQDKIAIWTKDASNQKSVMSIGKEMRKLLEIGDDIKLGYQVHADSLKRNSSYNNK